MIWNGRAKAKGHVEKRYHLSTIVTAVLHAFIATDVLISIDCWEEELCACDSSLLLTLPATACGSVAYACLRAS